MYSWIIPPPSCLILSRPHPCTRPYRGSRSRPHIFARNAHPVTQPRQKVEILPLEVVQRIAAGEVINSYDTVIQELVENSIDAHARIISVDIDLHTRSIIVSDDGIGISREQGLLDIARCNATSKLRSLTDLHRGVHTLGFRGQGLWAIAMTARLQVSSRERDSLCGGSVVFMNDGSPREDSITPIPMAVGTIATVTGLPWSTDQAEGKKTMKRCKDWLLRAAMCHPNISFRLTRSRKTVWRSIASQGSEEDARIRILAHELKLHSTDFRSASGMVPGIGVVSVVVGIPSTVQTSLKTWMTIAINGRCIGIPGIRRAISDVLNVKRGRYPVAFVSIATDPAFVNWNILPMKTKVRFNSIAAKEKLVAAIPSLLRDALQGSLSTSGRNEVNTGDNPSLLVDSSPRGGMKGVISLLSDKMSPSYGSDAGDGSNRIESEDESDALPIPMLQARVVAQVLNTYILIEHEGGIMLIEQHVADERVIYEDLLKTWKDNRLVGLEEPLKLPENMRTEWIFTLTTLGLVSCDHDDNMNEAYEVVAIPEILMGVPKSELVSLLLQICREGATVEEASASVACRLAVKNGSELNMREMEVIVRKLVRCDNGFTCPHGRPIFMELRTKELARLFGRTWLPERANHYNDAERGVLKSRGVLPE